MDSDTITIEDALNLLKSGGEGIEEWNQRRKSGASPIDLSELDLDGAELEGADLTHLNLTKTNFSRANLKRARFCFANVTQAKFRSAEYMRKDKLHGTLKGM